MLLKDQAVSKPNARCLVGLFRFLAKYEYIFMTTAQISHLYCISHALKYYTSNAKGPAHAEIEGGVGWIISCFSEKALLRQDWLSFSPWCPGINDLNLKLKPVRHCKKENKRDAKS